MKHLLRAAAGLALPLAALAVHAQPKLGCSDAPHRQFDFWVGQWDVTTPDGKAAGTNRIESIAQGCALLEHWEGRGGFSGKSLNTYDATDQRWHQEWVDAAGGRLTLTGGWTGSQMVLEGTLPDDKQPAQRVKQRISWTPQTDGSVRQLWETSADDGKTWDTAFDGKYVRKK
jgi:hypothetical protein